MKCIKCGYDNLEGMKYCVHCSAELITSEEKEKRHAEGEKGLNKLVKVIIGLIVVLALVVAAIFIVPMFMTKAKEEDDDNDSPAISDTVDQDTVGEWHCNNDEFDEDSYTITLFLQSDGIFKIGPKEALEYNRIEGTYTSNSFNATDETGAYNLYQVVMDGTLEVENGEQTEVEGTTTYSLGISAVDFSRGIFTNGADDTTYYCVR